MYPFYNTCCLIYRYRVFSEAGCVGVDGNKLWSSISDHLMQKVWEKETALCSGEICYVIALLSDSLILCDSLW